MLTYPSLTLLYLTLPNLTYPILNKPRQTKPNLTLYYYQLLKEVVREGLFELYEGFHVPWRSVLGLGY
jgi:hypothetical protein